MKSSFKGLGLGLSFFALLVCSASPVYAAKYKIKWLIGHVNLDYFEEAALNFKETVEKGSNGDIEVTIVTAKDSEEYLLRRPGPEIATAVASGEAEMGHSFTDVMGHMDHRLWAFDLPYVFRDYRHLEGVFEGPIGEELLAGLRQHKLVGLTFTYSGGANGIAAADREIRRPEDLKGLKVGTYGDTVDQAWLSSLGATPVFINHRQESIAPLAESKDIDAVVITWRRFERARLNPAFKYVSLVGSSYLVSVTYVNEKFFESLPAAYRELIKDSAHLTGRIERAKTIELNELAKRDMMAKGVRQVYLTSKNSDRFQEALRPVYQRSLDAIVGKDLIERLRNTPQGPVPLFTLDLADRR